MVTDDGKAILLGMDDTCFCDTLVTLLARASTGVTDEPPLLLLWQPWVLQRLQQIRTRASHVYFGVFLGPLRLACPGRIYPPELVEAMHTVSAEALEGGAGDVPTDVFLADAETFFAEGEERGLDPGWDTLAEHYTVRPGEFTVVTGIGSHMKSTWLQNLCVNLGREGWRFGVWSAEHHPRGQLARLLLEQYTGLTWSRDYFKSEPGEFRRGMAWVSDHFHVIHAPAEAQPTVPWLLAVARAQVERYGIQGLVLDPWNEIEHVYSRSETQYISECLSQVRRFARTHNVHVWIVAHPTKMQKAKDGDYAGTYPPPTPYDIAGSAHWHNKADNCLSIWRDVQEDSRQVEVHVQKVRNRAVGRPGLVRLQYTGRRFESVRHGEARTWES